MSLDCRFILPPDTPTPSFHKHLLDRVPCFDLSTHTFRG